MKTHERPRLTIPALSKCSRADLDYLQQRNVREILLGPRELSRFGDFSSDDVNQWARELKKRGIRRVLEWDILMTENRFSAAMWILQKIDFDLFDAIRVQDPGAYQCAKELCEKYPHLKIQMILETGHHNLQGIQRWIRDGGELIERVVLSIELPKARLKEIISQIPVETEILGLGRILLFYTPRSLVRPFVPAEKLVEEGMEVTGSSQESPHSGFPIVENRHGTFMFHLKDHCLLEDLGELAESGLDWFRVETRFLAPMEIFDSLMVPSFPPSQDQVGEIKDLWPAPTIQGFFRVNKTDVLFKKLKNSRIQRQDINFLGDVVDVLKGEHMAVLVRSQKRAIKAGDSLRINTPDGKEKKMKVTKMWDSLEKKLEKGEFNQIVFLPHLSGVSVRSLVFFDS